jgi:hypothetical protein
LTGHTGVNNEIFNYITPEVAIILFSEHPTHLLMETNDEVWDGKERINQ